MSDKSQAQAVELLTLDKALLIQLYHGETLPLAAGPCHVLLVSLDEQAAEAYLLLTVSRQDEEKDGIEVVVGSNHVVVLEPGPQGNKYRLQSPEMEGAEVILTLPPEAMINGQEEAFADVVEQYCGLHRPGPDTPQGRIELIDDQGSLLGTLDQTHQPVSFLEAEKGKEAMLVTLDDSQAADITTGPARQDKDWLINGANYVVHGLVRISGWAGGHIEKTADRLAPRGAVGGGFSGGFGASTPSVQPKLDEKSGTGIHGASYASDARSDRYRTPPSPSSSSNARRNINIHPSVSKGLQALSTGSGHVVSLSHSARKTLLDASEGAGRRLGGVRTNKDGTQRQPGLIRRQMQRGAQAVNLVLDGFDAAVEGLLQSAGRSTGQVVGHHLGSQAQTAVGHVGTLGRNTWLVYKDVSGVRRKVILKIAGGTLKGRTVDGQEITITAPPAADSAGSGGNRDHDSIEHEYIAGPTHSTSVTTTSSSTEAISGPLPPSYYDTERKL